MSFHIRWTSAAKDDLDRLFDFLIERELSRDGGDLDLAAKAIVAIEHGVGALSRSPFTCRKASASPFLRELVIPFASSGYVALFEIVNESTVVVAAVRHQREDDYH